MDIEIKRLQQVLAVVRCGSISRAATELHMTQPALSRSIATLEDRYGFKIFDRSKGGTTLTAIGKSVVAEAEVLLRQARSVDHNFKLYSSGQTGAIAFGIGPLLASLVLPSLSRHFLEKKYQLHLKFVTKSPDALVRELLDDRIEIMFYGGVAMNDQPELDSELIGRFDQIVVVRAGHPLSNKDQLSLDDIAEFPVLSGMDFPALQKQFRSGSIVCDNYHLLRDLTLQSDSIWISSTRLISTDPNAEKFTVLNVADSMMTRLTDVFMAYRSASKLSPAAIAVQDYVRAYLNQPG